MASGSPNKACMLLKADTVEIRDAPIAEVGKDDVLIRVEATGICGSDLHNYSHGGVGKDLIKEPLILGHESAGIVVEVGSAVTDVAVGDRVAIEPTMFCRKCHNCKTGKTNVCRNFRQASLSPTQGTLCQYYVCDADFAVKIPASISWEQAGCIQPLAVAIQLAKRAKFGAGQTVAVFGCGPLGCLVMATARAYGVTKILAFDISQRRVDFAKKLWADYAVLSPKVGQGQDYSEWAEGFKASALKEAGVDSWGVDISVEASGAEVCMHAGITFVHSGGTYVQAGLGRAVNSFPTFQVVAKELDVIGSVRYTAGCFKTAIDLMESGKIDLEPMITAVFPLSRSKEALEAVRKGDDLKVIIMNQQGLTGIQVKDINDNAAVARQQANTVDSRLAKVEETLEKLLPVTKALETWMRQNSQQFPFSVPNSDPGPSQHSQNSHKSSPEPSHPRVPYRPSAAIQQLSRYPSSGSVLSPTAASEIMDEEENEGPEQWSDRFSHLTKDSYGNLRYTGGTSTFMLVEALTTLQDSTSDASPESQTSNKSANITLPFFDPSGRFKVQEALPRPEDVVYPSPERADELVSLYFTRIHHTFPILHQHVFLERYTKTMAAKSSGKPSKDCAFLASLFAVFACGACISKKEKSADPQYRRFGGMEYYERAQLLFWTSAGLSQILPGYNVLPFWPSVMQTGTLLRKVGSMLVRPVRRAQDLGLHRSSRRSSLPPFEKEMRRRVWWCVYGIDRVLSIALGRPSGAHDDDCNVEMPAELDDAQLLASVEGATISKTGDSYMTGFVALLEIYIIAGKVMRFVHSLQINDPQSEQTRKTVAAIDAELEHWLNHLPPTVRFAANNRQNPKMLTLCLITFFVYYSAVIDLHRPFIPDGTSLSPDLTSLGQCMSAARSCIRIGEITQEASIDASDFAPFGVRGPIYNSKRAAEYGVNLNAKSVQLSGITLLRCVYYLNHQELVSAIINDADKCVKILEKMQEIWPASKRCGEIVSDLLVMVKTRLYGGSSAIEDLQAAQQLHTSKNQERPEPLSSTASASRGKRKRSDAEVVSPQRNRVNGNVWENGIASSSHVSEGHQNLNNNPHHSSSLGMMDPSLAEGRSHQRLSNLRTSMEPVAEPNGPYPGQHSYSPSQHNPVPGHPRIPQSPTHQMGPPPPPHAYPPANPAPPQLSLDINAIYAGQQIDGLPFSNDFIGDDLLALVGNVIKPSAQPSAQMFEENAQVLWQAFHGQQQDWPFTGGSG
ncbi:hypothetical protein EDD18DRAFT_1351062 [Armillaria luteobubalina]|uniref:Transcription factor domain-containing protein n=1 Tax=Armillaria luteobubalina TaxID=153913 RepID=A0AA39Q8S4_9AGAR|nr:hypothetical protein EDD18DRAFT_1351062 [Armillaria luteobubalina]